MAKILTPQVKVERVVPLLLNAMKAMRDNPNRSEAWDITLTSICQAFAILDSHRDDEFAITHLWVEIQKEVSGKKAVQVVLPGYLATTIKQPLPEKSTTKTKKGNNDGVVSG